MMDIEQLKLILATIEGAGEGAYTFAIFWLTKGLVLTAMWIGCIIYLARKLLVPLVEVPEREAFENALVKALGNGGPLIDSEREQILDIIRTAKKEKRT